MMWTSPTISPLTPPLIWSTKCSTSRRRRGSLAEPLPFELGRHRRVVVGRDLDESGDVGDRAVVVKVRWTAGMNLYCSVPTFL